MQDFYGSMDGQPADQAAGLRRLFSGDTQRFVAVVGNAHEPLSGVAIERLTAALALQGRRLLIIDAADTSPPAPEVALLELAPCIERLSPDIAYLPARGLPVRYVNTRGSSARLIEEATAAVPWADVVLVHASAPDLARLFTRKSLRPVLLAGLTPDSVKDAYASLKLLSQRCGWMSADLVMLADPAAALLPTVVRSLTSCADQFIGAAFTQWAAVSPKSAPRDMPDHRLIRLVEGHLDAGEERLTSPATWAPPSNRPVFDRPLHGAA